MDGKPPPKVPEPLFPLLRRFTAEDVQKARAWLLAWLLDRLGQRVQTPPPPAYHVQRSEGERWLPAVGPFYRQWLATQMARELNHLARRDCYRVVGPDGVVDLGTPNRGGGERPDGE